MTAIHIASVSRPQDRHSSRRIGTENQDTLNCAVEPCETVQEFEAPIARTKKSEMRLGSTRSEWSPSSTPLASRLRDGSTRRFRYRLTEYLVNAPPACVIEFGPSA